MKLKYIIQKSYYASVGYIENQSDVDRLEQYILYNIDVIRLFKRVIHSTTYKSNDPVLVESVNKLWSKYFPTCVSICNGVSRGHSFGACDNDDAVFDYCKKNNIEWICKSANDLIFDERILDIDIQDADFYYLNGIGYGGMIKYDFDFSRIAKEDFYPQTNFYFINVLKCDFLNDKIHIEDIYNKISSLSDYSGRAWEYGFKSCETLLADCINRNKLKKHHIIDNKTYIKLLNLIKDHHIHDPSHKNIMIDGVCHYHFKDQEVIEL